MTTKCPPVILATDSNSVKNKLLEKLVQLQMNAPCISLNELCSSPEEFLSDQPVIVLLDAGRSSVGAAMEKINPLMRFNLVRFIILIDQKMLDKFEPSRIADNFSFPALIPADPSMSELVQAIHYCNAMIELYAVERDQRREQWVQKALHGLYQRTGETDALLAGILGITATALNASCAVVTLTKDNHIASIISHSGVKTDRVALYWKRMPKSDLDSDVLPNFMQLKHVGPGRLPAQKNRNMFSPTTALIMRISRLSKEPPMICALGDPTHNFRETDKRIFMQSALLASAVLDYATTGTPGLNHFHDAHSSSHHQEL